MNNERKLDSRRVFGLMAGRQDARGYWIPRALGRLAQACSVPLPLTERFARFQPARKDKGQ